MFGVWPQHTCAMHCHPRVHAAWSRAHAKGVSHTASLCHTCACFQLLPWRVLGGFMSVDGSECTWHMAYRRSCLFFPLCILSTHVGLEG